MEVVETTTMVVTGACPIVLHDGDGIYTTLHTVMVVAIPCPIMGP